MSANQPNRPNILLIETDQWNGRCVSALGHLEVAKPHLDRLAEAGTRARGSGISLRRIPPLSQNEPNPPDIQEPGKFFRFFQYPLD